MDSYLTTQRSTIFQHVGVMIYVFDVESREMGKDLEYYRDCLEGLRQHSPEAGVFLLVHKMDLVKLRGDVLEKKKKDLEEESKGVGVVVFGTSIYDESLYRVCYHCHASTSLVLTHTLGVVENSAHTHPKRRRTLKTPNDVRRSMQCNRSNSL